MAVWGLAVTTGALWPGVHADIGRAGAPVRIGLVQGPIHTDLLLPLDADTRTDFAFLDLPPDARWLLVGWGAEGYYTTVGDYGDVSIPATLRAAFGSPSVMRFQPVGPWEPPLDLTIDRAHYDALRAVVLADTVVNRPVGRDLLSPGDRYFGARGTFWVANSCNQWANRTLRAAGLPFGRWTPTTWAVRLSLRIYDAG